MSSETVILVARAMSKVEGVDWEKLGEPGRNDWIKKAQRFTCKMGGEAELLAFCEAVLATRASARETI